MSVSDASESLYPPLPLSSSYSEAAAPPPLTPSPPPPLKLRGTLKVKLVPVSSKPREGTEAREWGLRAWGRMVMLLAFNQGPTGQRGFDSLRFHFHLNEINQ